MRQISKKINIVRNGENFPGSICFINETFLVMSESTHLLHPEERILYEFFKSDTRKHSFILGRIASKYAISEIITNCTLSDILISSGSFNFPVIEYDYIKNLHVSISHCNNLVMAIVFPEKQPVSIDLELISPENIQPLQSQMTPAEMELAQKFGLSKIVAATLLWSAKEALSKVLKVGMTIDFKLLEINLVTQKTMTYESTFKNFSQYKAMSFFLNNYVCSVVSPAKTDVDMNLIIEAFDQITSCI